MLPPFFYACGQGGEEGKQKRWTVREMVHLRAPEKKR